jgi:uncharacterized membrane protein
MAKTVLGIIVTIVGVIATLCGIFGGVLAMMKVMTKRGTTPPTDFVKALKEFLEALIKAPIWLALLVVGMALIALGGSFF